MLEQVWNEHGPVYAQAHTHARFLTLSSLRPHTPRAHMHGGKACGALGLPVIPRWVLPWEYLLVCSMCVCMHVCVSVGERASALAAAYLLSSNMRLHTRPSGPSFTLRPSLGKGGSCHGNISSSVARSKHCIA